MGCLNKKMSFRTLSIIVHIASTFSFELFKTVLRNFVTMVENWMDKYENLCAPLYHREVLKRGQLLYRMCLRMQGLEGEESF